MPESEQQFAPGTTCEIYANVEYALKFSGPILPRMAQELEEIGVKFINPQTCILTVEDFIGSFTIGPYTLVVISSKLSSEEHSQMLNSVATLSSELLFAWNSPLQTSSVRVDGFEGRVAFLDLLYLRSVFFPKKGDISVQDAFRIIAAQPVRKAVHKNYKTEIHKVSAVSSGTYQSIITSPYTWQKTPATSRASNLPLAQLLSINGDRYIPASVVIPRPEYTLDTHENQFLKRFLMDSRALVSKFSQRRDLRKSLLDDLHMMISAIDEMLNSSFFNNVQALKGPLRVSQTLLKSPGYKLYFEAYKGLNSLKSTFSQEKELSYLSDGRDLPKLFEYWVFMEVAKAVSLKLGSPISSTSIESDDESALIPRGSTIKFQNEVTVSYDMHFRGKSAMESYSLSLRPDVVITVGQDMHVIDAKFRADLTKLKAEADNEARGKNYKNEDIYKMHTYRDALHSVRSCWVAYPGDRSVFFCVNGTQYSPEDKFQPDGVGAIGMRPGQNLEQLLCVIDRILTATSLQ